ncbi:MAG: hypothetical protein U9Q62_03880 [Campylobacterota bacterium]|nr:hypothetical protein [Campylobacterota bacterium]
MKPIFYLLLLMPYLLLAESFLVSSIPLPKSYVQNMDPLPCDEACLNDLIIHEQIFSFLAHAQGRIEDPELNDVRLIYVTVFNLGAARESSELKIALLLPHRVIGRYAFSTTNAVFAYMLAKNRAFEVRTFQIEDESIESIDHALRDMQEDGFYYVIAPVTKQGATHIAQIDPDMSVYFPTINRKDISGASPSLYFGAIDYRAQIDTLLQEAVSPLVVFYDQSTLGKELHQYTRESFVTVDENPTMFLETDDEAIEKEVFSYAIGRQTSNLEYQLKGNQKIQYGSFVLNTPIVKSGMVMSQLTLYDANATNVLSTQINYDPIIFSMTQYHDRKEMVIANSIGHNNNILVEANSLLSNDIVYDWINYATTVGTDLFYHLITRSDREYDLPLEMNQIEYPISLVKPSLSRFLAYTPTDMEADDPNP